MLCWSTACVESLVGLADSVPQPAQPELSTKAKRMLKNSVFLFGPGRSGTTIFYRVLASHPALGWISNYNELLPKYPSVAALSRIRHVDSWSRKRGRISRVLPTPKEALAVPRTITAGHFQVSKIIDRENIDADAVDRYQDYLSRLLSWQGRSRLVHKHTGFARLHFLSRVDSTARYIRIIRDGRAVVNSLLNVDWWDGSMESWWWDDMSQDYSDEYERNGKSKESLAAISWKTMHDLQDVEIEQNPELPLMTVTYSDFVSNAVDIMREVCEFSGLDFSAEFQQNIQKFSLTDNDMKWQQQLTKEQQDYLNESLSQHLARYGLA